jgi:DNA replication protein DnaC
MIDSKDCWLIDNCKQLHCNDKNGCLILYKLNYLYNEANVPINLRKNIPLRTDADGTDLEEFKQLKNIQDNIVKFVSGGGQLHIHSKQAGNGKSSWAIRLLQTYFNNIWLRTDLKCRALFVNVPLFLLKLKESISNKSDYIDHIKENIYDCDLVIWDDIGTKSATVYEGENLLSIIDYRIGNGKANIFTSNLNNKELHEALGDRLASRICNSGINIEFKGGDKRGFGPTE